MFHINFNDEQDPIISEYMSLNYSEHLQIIRMSVFNNNIIRSSNGKVEPIDQKSIVKYTEQYKTFFENLKKASKTYPEKSYEYACLLYDTDCPKSIFTFVKEYLVKVIPDDEDYIHMISLGI